MLQANSTTLRSISPFLLIILRGGQLSRSNHAQMGKQEEGCIERRGEQLVRSLDRREGEIGGEGRRERGGGGSKITEGQYGRSIYNHD